MGKISGIAWCDASWGPWRGCTKVSTGCAACYAERDMTKYGHDFSVVTRASEKTFRAPLHWKGRLRIFATPWSDYFHPAADAWRDEAWNVIAQSSHTFLILTKRPERISVRTLPAFWELGWPHVWFGVSTENQQTLDHRVPLLAAIPAAHRFLSAEPLLGPLDLTRTLGDHAAPEWIIVSGESGPAARSMQLEWAYSIVEQCDAAGVPVFIKQDSGPRPGQQGRIPADLWQRKEIPHARS